MKKEPYAIDFQRLRKITRLWGQGAITILAVLAGVWFFMQGWGWLLNIIGNAYLLAFLLLGAIIIPILIAMFILPRFGIEA